ncbi:MAG TPA: hypothetical protein PLU73_08225 [Bacteroidia bacterium]|nr:hypothetical protein [Bacteroidia bacterium]
MKQLKYTGFALLALVIAIACKKKSDNPPPDEAPAPKRATISYYLSVIPRAENKTNKDTLIIKVNGAAIITSKGSVADAYPAYPVKTGDQVSIYYNPGKIVTTNSVTLIDDNGLLLSLDYDINNNKKLKEYSCRCIANEIVTVE